MAFSKTFEQKRQYTMLKQEESLFENAPKKLSLLKQKEVYYDSLLNRYQLNGSSIQNSLLKTINTYADDHDLEVISFLEPHILTQNGLTVKTYEFVIEGHFNAIHKLIYQLEQNTKFGEVINLHYEKKKHFRSGRYYLQTKVLLRSYG
ncbi:hypothetical protein KWG70_00060 [Psychroserpens sp. XSD401]|nr:hypothetical protein [Psychroserpens luteolus]